MIANRYGLITVEDLNIKNMSKSPTPKLDVETGKYLPNGHAAKAGLNKSILYAERGSPTGTPNPSRGSEGFGIPFV